MSILKLFKFLVLWMVASFCLSWLLLRGINLLENFTTIDKIVIVILVLVGLECLYELIKDKTVEDEKTEER